MLLKIIFTLILVALGFYIFLSCANFGDEIVRNNSLTKDAKKHVVLCETISCILILFLVFSIWDKPDSNRCVLSEDDYVMLEGCIDELSFLCDKYSDVPDDEINTLLNLISDTLKSNYIKIED